MNIPTRKLQYDKDALGAYAYLIGEIKMLKAVSYDDVMKRFDVFDDANAVLSVIKPLED